ncbi:MAG: hypothetical protein I4O51_01105, partial [Flavobacterium micromati]|nr:hypothetical protein [Flavobacterium micromati]
MNIFLEPSSGPDASGGLQSHQFNGTRKSKWRTQFNNVSVQHQTHDEYSGNSR